MFQLPQNDCGLVPAYKNIIVEMFQLMKKKMNLFQLIIQKLFRMTTMEKLHDGFIELYSKYYLPIKDETVLMEGDIQRLSKVVMW